ncbi:hypothetical protein OIU85_026790 [Salix viminalis]|uniref:Uncharacterized protein n=1 Tax=Salix viminalis TaxID=40686 RepID=A0A9Q0TPC2_SALVM|nr:hypothetical protein OIU85_026790 [Salix viminalis]
MMAGNPSWWSMHPPSQQTSALLSSSLHLSSPPNMYLDLLHSLRILCLIIKSFHSHGTSYFWVVLQEMKIGTLPM